MKFQLPILAVLALLLPGCDQSKTQNAAGKKLSLSQPSNQTLTRGETNEIAISINRENFATAVKVTFSNLPNGVHVVDEREIPGDQSRMTYTLHAANDADLVANHESRVTAEGPDKMATTQTFKLTIQEK